MPSESANSQRGLLLAALGLLGACASMPPPTDAVSEADLALQQAETAQAAIYAPGDLLRAREQLDGAKAQVRSEHYAKARRLAEQSAANSQLAIARSRAAIAEASHKAAQESVNAFGSRRRPLRRRQPRRSRSRARRRRCASMIAAAWLLGRGAARRGLAGCWRVAPAGRRRSIRRRPRSTRPEPTPSCSNTPRPRSSAPGWRWRTRTRQRRTAPSRRPGQQGLRGRRNRRRRARHRRGAPQPRAGPALEVSRPRSGRRC